MSYREQDGQVILAMSREDYERLLGVLGLATGHPAHDAISRMRIVEFVNRLNQGNPDYTPSQVVKDEGAA